MSSHTLIDAQFDRAVQIVQGLPKTGPIQTDYEEKLTMYSLYKQATAGNVKSPRPGIWDMLGRAKWDAWAKHKDLDPFEAKWLYVEALLKVLRKYSDKTVAMDLVEELESYSGDPSHIIMSRSLSRSPHSDASSSSTLSEPTRAKNHLRHIYPPQETETDSASEGGSEGDVQELPASTSTRGRQSADIGRTSLENRPHSSLSSQQHYRTPLTTSLVLSPPPSRSHDQTPFQQPLPLLQTQSVFANSLPAPDTFPHVYEGHMEDQRGNVRSSPSIYPGRAGYGTQSQSNRSTYAGIRPPSAVAIERAVENVQVELAALTERIELLESRALLHSRSNVSGSPYGSRSSPSRMNGRGSPNGNAPAVWDIDDLGMWSLVLNPLIRGWDNLRELSTFFARNESRSPSMVIIRRLCLDVSFLACVVAIIGAIWRKSGVRRREVKAALVALWSAIIGTKPQRALADMSC